MTFVDDVRELAGRWADQVRLPTAGQVVDALRDPSKHKLLIPPQHNPHFLPAAGSLPLSVLAAILPPLTYFLALVLLPPFDQARHSSLTRTAATFTRLLLAAVSVVSFVRLPFTYHVPGSATLSYQLGLIGCYGGGRVLDIFFLSWPRVPRRVAFPQDDAKRREVEMKDERGREEPSHHKERYFHSDNNTWQFQPHPTGLLQRLWYAFDLMISMRGIGWDFATADVRHDRHPWQPPSTRQLHRAVFKLLPFLAISLTTLRWLVQTARARSQDLEHTSIASLPAYQRFQFVIATGIALYVLFDFGFTIVSALGIPFLKRSAILVDQLSDAHPSQSATKGLAAPGDRISAHNVDFFPLLNPISFLGFTSLRAFWSKIWHRLFHRVWLIYGVLPVQNFALLLERFVARLAGTSSHVKPVDFGATWPANHPDPGRVLERGRADWGKVMGAFIASGLVHAVSERCALGGRLAQPPPHHLHAPSAGVFREATRVGQSTSFWTSFLSRERQVIAHRVEADQALTSLGKWSLSRIVPPISGAGEFTFFFLNGVAVCIEGVIANYVRERRRHLVIATKRAQGHRGEIEVSKAELTQWYDGFIGVIWAVAILAYTGECFVEGWIRSGIVEELTFLLL